VTLRTTGFYKSWNILQQAEVSGLKLLRKEKFDEKIYPGYQNCRTASADLFRQAPSTETAETFMFVTQRSPVKPEKHKKRKEKNKNKNKKTNTDQNKFVENISDVVKQQQTRKSLRCEVCEIDFDSRKKYKKHLDSAVHENGTTTLRHVIPHQQTQRETPKPQKRKRNQNKMQLFLKKRRLQQQSEQAIDPKYKR